MVVILGGSCAHLAVLELGDEGEGKGDGELHLEGWIGGLILLEVMLVDCVCRCRLEFSFESRVLPFYI
jgi:hypothetical protein